MDTSCMLKAGKEILSDDSDSNDLHEYFLLHTYKLLDFIMAVKGNVSSENDLLFNEDLSTFLSFLLCSHLKSTTHHGPNLQIPLTTRINNIFSCKTVRNVSIASLSKVHLSICDGLEAPDMEHGVELPQVQYEDKPWIITTITYLILWDPNAIIQLHVDGLQYNSTKTRNFLKKSPKCATLKIPPELERNAQKNVIFGKCRNS
ncbi:uncharacterized protein [Phyllobates terribilis]|uniref:uncharacterized protein n=1 Tax=Phyllobates terribilis TaxID=111132 RepID=UPI003CCAE7DE